MPTGRMRRNKPDQTVSPAFQAHVSNWQPRIDEHGLLPSLVSLEGLQLYKVALQALFSGVADSADFVEDGNAAAAGQGERLAACIGPLWLGCDGVRWPGS